MGNFETELNKKDVSGRWKRGQYYVKLPNYSGKLKIKSINPESFARATEDDEFSVTLESTSGNVWTEYFETAKEVADFVAEKIEESKQKE